MPFKKAFHIYDEIKEHAQKAVTNHKSSRVSGEPRDLIDCYLDQIDMVTNQERNITMQVQ